MSDITREALVRQMLDAFSEEDVRVAKRAATGWLREHRNDPMVLSAGEQLAMVDEVLKELNKARSRQSA